MCGLIRCRLVLRGVAAAAFLLSHLDAADAATTNVAFGGPTIGSYNFRPKSVTINAGDTVIWSNSGGTHTVTGTGSDVLCGSVTVSTSCSHTFATPGVYPYECIYHSDTPYFMTGVVHVAGVTLPPPPTLSNAVVLSNKQFRFTVLTTPNHTNTIRAYTNLNFQTNWTVVGTVVPTSNSFTFTDSNAASFGIRIYRVIEQ